MSEKPRSGGRSAQQRLTGLLFVFLLAVGALAYDKMIAQAGWFAAIKTLDGVVDEYVGTTKKQARESSVKGKDSQEDSREPSKLVDVKLYRVADIHSALKIKPVLSGKAAEAPHKLPSAMLSQVDAKHWATRKGYWELYQWRRGIPFLHYSLIVVYSGSSNPLFSKHIGGGPLSPSDFQGITIPEFDEQNPPKGNAPIAAGWDLSTNKKTSPEKSQDMRKAGDKPMGDAR